VTPAHIRPTRGRRVPLLLAVALAAVIAAHLGVAGYAVTNWGWSLAVIGGAAAMLGAKMLLILGYRTARRHRSQSSARMESTGRRDTEHDHTGDDHAGHDHDGHPHH
jgi:hypothetical protein